MCETLKPKQKCFPYKEPPCNRCALCKLQTFNTKVATWRKVYVCQMSCLVDGCQGLKTDSKCNYGLIAVLHAQGLQEPLWGATGAVPCWTQPVPATRQAGWHLWEKGFMEEQNLPRPTGFSILFSPLILLRREEWESGCVGTWQRAKVNPPRLINCS